MSSEAFCLISQMLAKNPERRLGCTAEGARTIKGHPFFATIDWNRLEKKLLKPLLVPHEDKGEALGFLGNNVLVSSLGNRCDE